MKKLQPKYIGYWMVVFGWIGMLIALYRDNITIVFMEAVFMLVGAVLSLHPVRQKEQSIRNLTFNMAEPQDLADEVAKLSAARRVNRR